MTIHQTIVELFDPLWVWVEAKQPMTLEELQADGLPVDETPKWTQKGVNHICTLKIKKGLDSTRNGDRL